MKVFYFTTHIFELFTTLGSKSSPRIGHPAPNTPQEDYSILKVQYVFSLFAKSNSTIFEPYIKANKMYS